MDPKLLDALKALASDPIAKAALAAALGLDAPTAPALAASTEKAPEVVYYVAHKCRGCGMNTRAIVSTNPSAEPPVNAGPRDDLPAGTLPGARVDAPPPPLPAVPAGPAGGAPSMLPAQAVARAAVRPEDVRTLGAARLAAIGLEPAPNPAELDVSAP